MTSSSTGIIAAQLQLVNLGNSHNEEPSTTWCGGGWMPKQSHGEILAREAGN